MRFPLVVTLLVGAAGAFAADPGYVENFPAGSLGEFFSGATLDNPGTGGVDGAGDGYLRITRDTSAQFAAATSSTHFTGNLIADGVTGFRLYLNDVGASQNFQIHVAVGTATTNFWMYTPTFVPINGQWSQFFVDLNDTANWVQVQGSGTFAAALQNSNRLQIRHDAPPFGSGGDPIMGDLGVDKIVVVPEPASIAAMLGGLFSLVGARGFARKRPRE